MLDPQHLRSFQEIARTGSYSAAARRLGYSQPALSYQMRLLEKAVGASLTVRVGRTVRLTPAGQMLLRHAGQILTAIRVAERDLAQVVGARAGALRIAAFPSAAATLVPTAIGAVTASYPAVDAQLIEASPADAAAMVARGDAELAVTNRLASIDDDGSTLVDLGRRRDPLVRTDLLDDQMHLVLPVRHPLANAPIVDLWPLADENWLLASPELVEVVQPLAARAGFAVRTSVIAEDYVALQALVASGVGIGVVPGLALLAHRHDGVVAQPLDDWPVRHVAVESWPDLLRVASVAAMVEALDEAAATAVRAAPTGLLLSRPAVTTTASPPSATPVGVGDERADDVSWRQWFAVPRRRFPLVAASDPDRGIRLSDESGTMQVHEWRRGVDDGPAATAHPGGVALAGISADGSSVWWFADDGGDERGVWMVQPARPDGDHAPADEVVDAVVAASEITAGFSSGLVVGSRRAVVGRSDSDGAEVFVVELDRVGQPGAGRLVYANEQFATAGALSVDERLVAIAHSEHGDAQKPAVRVLQLSADGGEPTAVADLWDGHGRGVWPIAFSPRAGSTELLVVHERHGRSQPLIWDPVAGTEREIDPPMSGETRAWWYPSGEALLVLNQYRARSELYRIDLDTAVATLLPTPRGAIDDAEPRPDGTVDYLWSSATAAPRLLTTGASEPLEAPTPVAARPALSDLTIAGSAGEIHILVGPSPGGGAPGSGPHPTVFLVHGGPALQDVDEYSAVRNAWMSAGYVTVQVNYRGSTGYGREWRNANIGRPGRAELDDIVATRDALVADGVADPDRIVIAGESWGGYLALLGLGLYPGLWSLGVALVPVADTAAVYEDMMEEIRAAYRVRFGGSPADVPDVYAASSPLGVAADINVPVLITGGLRDTRCPIRQIELFAARLDELGKAHELHTFDRGHVARSVDDRLAEMTAVLAFTERHLGPTLAS